MDGTTSARTARVSIESPAAMVVPIWAMLSTLPPSSTACRRSRFRALKDSSAEELIRAVRAVARGDSYLDLAVTSRVLTTYRKAANGPRGNDIAELTSRELDVLSLIGKGLSNAEIADELRISGVTVKSHIGRIFGKLDLRDRAAAIVYAYDIGLVAPR
jgi:DNA-binding NarL/FixJ family response regulator